MTAKGFRKKRVLSFKLLLLLLISLLIGLLFIFTPHAHSEWKKEDTVILRKTPTSQGWNQVIFKEDSITDSNETSKP